MSFFCDFCVSEKKVNLICALDNWEQSGLFEHPNQLCKSKTLDALGSEWETFPTLLYKLTELCALYSNRKVFLKFLTGNSSFSIFFF